MLATLCLWPSGGIKLILNNALIFPQDSDTCVEKDEGKEESADCEQGETLESLESLSVEDVREVLGEMTREMLVKVQV